MRLPKNDGWTDIEYDLGLDDASNQRISRVLNEVCHVFRHHADGNWKTHDRDAYASALAREIREHRGLIKKLLDTDDRVVKNVTYRAIELLKEDSTADSK